MDSSNQSYTVKQVAKASGISVRTLHFYDEIGLLTPAFVGANGYRYYRYAQLQRLQDILFFRELGLPLEEVRALLKQPEYDRLATLRRHRAALEQKADRMAQLIRTIDRTIASIELQTEMNPDEMYTGVSPEKQAEYEQYVKDRYGACGAGSVEEAKQRLRNWTKADYASLKAEHTEVARALAENYRAGLRSDAPEVQANIRRHYRAVCRTWQPNRQAYIGLGQLYADHPGFRSFYGQGESGVPAFIASAITMFAERELNI